MTRRPMRTLCSLALACFSGLAACASTTERSGQAPALKNEAPATSFENAKKLLDQGSVAEAITAFRTLLRDKGPSVPVLNGLAIAHAEIGRPDLAAEPFAKALAIAPDDPVTLNNIGYAALRRKETTLARRYLEKAAKFGDDQARIGGNLKVLDRLETLLSEGKPIRLNAPVHTSKALFTVQRQTASTLRVAGLQITAAAPSRSDELPRLKGKTLIDFSDVFDPWLSSPPRPKPSPSSKPSSP